MDAFGRGNATSAPASLDRDRSARTRRPQARRRLALLRALIGWALLLAAPVAAQLDDETALAIYEELGPTALDGSLEPELAPDLLLASERLYRIRSEDVLPRELLEAALLAAEACGDRPNTEAIWLKRTSDLMRAESDLAGLIGLVEPRLDALAEALPRDRNVLYVQLLRVQVLRELQRWDAARDGLDTLLPRILESPERAAFESIAYGEHASLSLSFGLIDHAWSWHERQRAALGALETPDDNIRRNADLVEANLLLAREDHAELDRRVEEMLADGSLYGARSLQRGRLLVRSGLARLRSDPARLELAREALMAALSISTLEPYERRRAQVALAEVELCLGLRQEAERLLGEALSSLAGAPPPDIVALATSLRARLVREDPEATDAARASALSDLRKAYASFLSTWGELPLRPGGLGFFHYTGNLRLLGELIQSTLELDGQHGTRQAFEYVLQAQRLSTLVRRLDPEARIELEELRAELCAPGQGILVFVPAPERSHLFMLDGGRLEHVELESLARLRAPQELLVRRYLSPPPAAPDERARFDEGREACLLEIARSLLPPGARATLRRWTHVTIVGAEIIADIPLEDLLLEGGRTLGEACALGYSSSLPTLGRLARRGRSRERWPGVEAVQVFVNPVPHPELARAYALAPLPFGAEGARALVQAYPEDEVLLVFEAGPEDLRDLPLLRGARVLQLVAHGIEDLSEERPAALVLAGATPEEALLRCRDVGELEMPPLVVVAACSAARGPLRVGDAGAADLGGAFLAAGADAVVISPYPLEYHATARLLKAFHEELAAGAAPSEALQRARAVLRVDPLHGDEHMHSLLRVIGLAHQPIFAPNRWRTALLVLSGLVALALLALLVWRVAFRPRESLERR